MVKMTNSKIHNNVLNMRFFWFGLVLLVLGKFIVWGFAVGNGSWSDTSHKKIYSDIEQCKLQEQYRETVIAELNHRQEVSLNRLDLFTHAQTNPDSKFFLNAKMLISKESKELETINNRIESYPFQSLKTLMHYQLLLLLVSCFGLFFVSKALSKDSVKVGIKITSDHPYNRLYILISLGLFFFTYARYFYTSYILETKKWFTWESFCISPEIFFLSIFPVLGMAMLQAFPLVLWIAYSNKKHVPDLNFDSNDGMCGTRRYIQFLEKWMIVGFAVILINSIIWFKTAMFGGGDGLNYGAMTLAGVVFISILLLRGVRNLMVIRESYFEKLYALDREGKQLTNKVDDPASELLGKYWWKLIVIFISLIGFISAIYNNLSIVEWFTKHQ